MANTYGTSGWLPSRAQSAPCCEGERSERNRLTLGKAGVAKAQEALLAWLTARGWSTQPLVQEVMMSGWGMTRKADERLDYGVTLKNEGRSF